MKIARQPGDEHVERPVVAEVRGNEREHQRRVQQLAPGHRRHGARRRRGQQRALGVRDARIGGGAVVHAAPEGRHPYKAERAEDVEGRRPAQARGEIGGGHETHDLAERYAAEEPRQRTRALGSRNPAAEELVARRQHRRLAEPEPNARTDQHGHRHCRRGRGEQRKQRPPQHRNSQHPLAAEALRERAARDLKEQVADEKAGEHQALHRLAPVKLLAHGHHGHGEVYPVGVGEKHGGHREGDHHVPAARGGCRRCS